MDYVLLSPNDGELLKKAHQMLLDGGVKDDKEWNKYKNPDMNNERAEKENRKVWWFALKVSFRHLDMNFHNHDCQDDTTIQIFLTKRNLKKSVAIVLNAYKAAQS